MCTFLFCGKAKRNIQCLSLHEDKVYRQNEATESGKVVPVQCFATEEHGGEHGEDNERDDLLDDLQLHQREGAAVARKADAVGRYLAGILEQGNAP